jgi:hypothetical protein
LGLYFEMTGDESNIIRSVMEREYAGLLQPLGYGAVSPPLFLWMTKFLDSCFQNEWGVRLVPFLAGLAAVGIFWRICCETLYGPARWLAWAILCVSYVPVAEGTRSKGYTIDLLVAMVMLWLMLQWLNKGHKARYLAWLALCAPLLVWLSYTSVFVIGAIGMIFAAWLLKKLFVNRTVQQGDGLDWKSVLAGLSFMILAAIAAIYLYHTNIGPSLQAKHRERVDELWKAGFPPSGQFWKIPLWLLTVHTGRGFAWPVGEDHFGSTLTTVLWATGLITYWQRGSKWVWTLFVAPQALSLAAAFLHKYPYLANPRISMFLGPGICVFMGTGVQFLIDRTRGERRLPLYRFTALVLALCAVGGIARDVIQRTREIKGPGIRSTLAEASRQVGAEGQFVVLNFGNGSGVFNYYIRRGIGQRPWSSEKIPEQITAGQRIAFVAGASENDKSDRDRLVQDLEKKVGRPVRIVWSRIAHQILQDNKDSFDVWVCE